MDLRIRSYNENIKGVSPYHIFILKICNNCIESMKTYSYKVIYLGESFLMVQGDSKIIFIIKNYFENPKMVLSLVD